MTVYCVKWIVSFIKIERSCPGTAQLQWNVGWLCHIDGRPHDIQCTCPRTAQWQAACQLTIARVGRSAFLHRLHRLSHSGATVADDLITAENDCLVGWLARLVRAGQRLGSNLMGWQWGLQGAPADTPRGAGPDAPVRRPDTRGLDSDAGHGGTDGVGEDLIVVV